MLWMSKYSSVLLIHGMHCFLSSSNLGNSSFTLIWYLSVGGIDIDGMLNKWTLWGSFVSCCPGVLCVLGWGVLKGSTPGLWLGGRNEVCSDNLAKILLRYSQFFVLSYALMPFSIPILSHATVDVNALFFSSLSFTYSLLTFSSSWSNLALTSPILVTTKILFTLNLDLFL